MIFSKIWYKFSGFDLCQESKVDTKRALIPIVCQINKKAFSL